MLNSNTISKLRSSIRERRTLRDRGYIYLVGANKVAKKYWSKEPALREFEYGCLLFSHGVKVPRYYGVVGPDSFFLKKFRSNPIENWYLVMERVEGIRYEKINESDIGEFQRGHRRELEKALKLGVHPTSSIDISDCIFDSESKEVFLIDFSHWENGNINEVKLYLERLDQFYNSLRK